MAGTRAVARSLARWSFRWQLLGFALAVAVPLMAFSVVQSHRFAEEQRSVVERSSLQVATALATAIDRELQASLQVLAALATSTHLDQDRLALFHEEARRVQAGQPWYGVWLADPEGRTLVSSLRPFGMPLPDIGDRDYFQRVLAAGAPAISGLIGGRVTSGYSVAVGVPVVRDGRLKYVLAAGFKPEVLAGILSAQPALRPDTVASVVDAAHTIVARTRDAEKWVGRPASDAYSKAIAGRERGFVETRTVDGVAAYAAFSGIPRSGWVVGIGVPLETVQGVVDRAHQETALFGGAMLVLAVALAVGLSRRITRPIAELAAAAGALGTGAEIRLLGRQPIPEVNALAAALRRADEAVRERDVLAQRERDLLAAQDRAKDDFLAMLSHELRNPLAAITAASEVLRRAPDGLPAVKARAIVERQVRHMARLVEELLDVSSITTGRVRLQPERFDLATLVRDVLKQFADGRLKDRALSIRLEPAWVNADRSRTEQVVVNLLDNAAKFTAEGGRVQIDVAQVDGVATLAVSDDGAGFPPEQAEAIFRPFVQGEQGIDRARGGIGAGLAIVRRLVELQGGSVGAQSEGAGTGARFVVTLPAVQPPAPQAAAVAPVVRSGPRRHRILLVEDNDDVRRTLRDALEMNGHEVHEAPDARTALDIAARTRPAILLIDLGLPDLDGYELAVRLRDQHDGAVLLIALTGYGQPEDRARTRRAGFDGHLVKPVSVDRLEDEIAALSPAARAA